MDEVQKSTLLTSLPGDSEHTDFGESLLQKKRSERAQQYLPLAQWWNPWLWNQVLQLSGEAPATAPEQDACDECQSHLAQRGTQVVLSPPAFIPKKLQMLFRTQITTIR